MLAAVLGTAVEQLAVLGVVLDKELVGPAWGTRL
jgi:hypothetical protein